MKTASRQGAKEPRFRPGPDDMEMVRGGPSMVETERSKRRRFAGVVRRTLKGVGDLLIAKNKAYGDSALNPVGIFAKGNAEELIRVRIDDKLSRIANNPDAFGEDPIDDLLGYLVLLKLARRGWK